MDKIDVGMGYEIATKWEPRLQYWMDGLEEWHLSTNGEDLGLADGLTYRRKLPILTNHPEAIPLEPGEELVNGTDCLTRSGATVTYSGKYGHWNANGRSKSSRQCDIIARLPKVAKEAELPKLEIVACDAVPPGTILAMTDGKVVGKITNIKPEAEKAKEEKVSSSDSWLNVGKWKRYEHYGVSKVEIPPSEAARLYLENESVRAEVKRQEEAKRIGPGDWAFDKIRQCVFEVKKVGRHQVVGIEMAFSDDACEEAHELSECRKLNLSTELIAALNAQIDGKAGG